MSVHVLQEISVSLWALAKLGFHPGRMLAEFGARIEVIEQEFLPQACSNTLWALAVLQVCTPGTHMSLGVLLLSLFDLLLIDTVQARGRHTLQPFAILPCG